VKNAFMYHATDSGKSQYQIDERASTQQLLWVPNEALSGRSKGHTIRIARLPLKTEMLYGIIISPSKMSQTVYKQSTAHVNSTLDMKIRVRIKCVYLSIQSDFEGLASSSMVV
jgi:hypothetical protein